LGSFYRYVNSKLVHKTGLGVLIENGSYVYDDQTKARILNDFYTSVFLLTKLKPRTSGGPDGLPAMFLKILLVP